MRLTPLVLAGLAAPLAAQVPALGPRDGTSLAASDTGRVSVGSLAPDFTLAALAGPPVTLSDRYGLLNLDGRGWPRPTVYVIDRAGNVRWKFTEVNYRIRPTNQMILEALREVR